MNGSPHSYISSLVSYDPLTGDFWSLWTKKKKAIEVTKNGYARLSIGRKRYLAHRVAWLLTYGEWPKGHLDHRDTNKLNNRLENLRQSTRSQNAMNRALSSRYISKCIWFDNTKKKRLKRYCVRVQANGKRHHIGWFATEGDAKQAVILAIKEHHLEFSNMEKKNGLPKS